MDKLIEDLLNIDFDINMKIEEIEEIEEITEDTNYKIVYIENTIVNNPDRFDINCKCKSCLSLTQNCFEDL